MKNASHKIFVLFGQSMVEMIIAIAVIILILTGLITATTSSLSRSVDVSQRSQATKLAQGGIEVARQIRDKDWSEFIAYKGTTKYLVNGQFADNPGDTYVHTLQFTDCSPSSSTCVVVISKVAWKEKGSTKNISVQSTFTQWK